VFLPVLLVLLLQGLAGNRYGPFRDELYYQACATRLDFGYVDHPPLSVWLLRAWSDLFSTSEASVRSLSAVISVLSVLCICRLTSRLGGSPAAVLIAGLVFAASPVMRVIGTLYSPNTLDPLTWGLATLCWYDCLEDRKSAGKWSLLGLALGLACLNRLSGLWLIAALILGTAFSGAPWPSLPAVGAAAGVCGLCVAPWVGWQLAYHWPTVEFLRNANLYKLNRVGPVQFVLTQLAVMNILSAPVWIAGVWTGIKSERRAGAIAFLTVVLILLINGRSRENYLSPAYVFVVPGGAIAVSAWLRNWRLPAYASALTLSGLLFGLICLPILPIDELASVLGRLPTPPSAEAGPKSRLQGLADTTGWPEMAEQVAAVWKKLPPQTAIMASNYGEASALLKYGPPLGLPPPICGHNQFWLWGPRDWDGKEALVLGEPGSEILSSFHSVQSLGSLSLPYATPEEAAAPLRLAKDLNCPVTEFWARAKRFE